MEPERSHQNDDDDLMERISLEFSLIADEFSRCGKLQCESKIGPHQSRAHSIDLISESESNQYLFRRKSKPIIELREIDYEYLDYSQNDSRRDGPEQIFGDKKHQNKSTQNQAQEQH